MNPGGTPKLDERGIIQSLEADIEAGSVFTDDEKFTEKIKGDDGLKVKEHPKISFTSTKIKTPGQSEEEMVIHGNLSIAGNKKEISFPVKASKEGSAFWMKANFKVKPSDLGLKGDDEITIGVTIGADPNAKATDKKE
jgi:polyisoprenoid-binding protein YceI